MCPSSASSSTSSASRDSISISISTKDLEEEVLAGGSDGDSEVYGTEETGDGGGDSLADVDFFKEMRKLMFKEVLRHILLYLLFLLVLVVVRRKVAPSSMLAPSSSPAEDMIAWTVTKVEETGRTRLIVVAF